MKMPTTFAAIGLLVAVAAPQAAQAQGAPGQDSVTGSGTASIFSFVLDAHSGPGGENPGGTAGTSLTTVPSVFSRGRVTCLSVNGNRAVIGIANDPGSVGAGTLIEVTDGPDTLVFALRAAPPTDCSGRVDAEAATVTSGDIAIREAAALPVSKDQCKKDGWRTYRVFKNQGDCVSFVATKGKNPSAGTPKP